MACFYNILNVQEDQKVDDSSAFEELGRLGEEIDLLPDRTNTEPEKQRKQERLICKQGTSRGKAHSVYYPRKKADILQGHPTTIFGKISVRKTI